MWNRWVVIFKASKRNSTTAFLYSNDISSYIIPSRGNQSAWIQWYKVTLGIGCDPNQNGGILIPGSTGRRLRQTPNHQWNTGIGGSCISQMETHPLLPRTGHQGRKKEKEDQTRLIIYKPNMFHICKGASPQATMEPLQTKVQWYIWNLTTSKHVERIPCLSVSDAKPTNCIVWCGLSNLEGHSSNPVNIC